MMVVSRWMVSWAIALTGLHSISEARACSRVGYVAPPMEPIRYVSVEDVFRSPPIVVLAATGEAVLELPRKRSSDLWSVYPVPVDAAAVANDDGPASGPLSVYRFSYARLHPMEVVALSQGDESLLSRTRWRHSGGFEVPLKIVYRAKGQRQRETEGRLNIFRGQPVFLPPAPIVVLAEGPETQGSVSDGRVFVVRLGGGTNTWTMPSADARSMDGRRHDVDAVEVGGEFEIRGAGQVMDLVFVAASNGERRRVRLEVRPTPKC